MATADFWLFRKLTTVLKGKRFPDIEDIKSSVKKFWQAFLFRILKTVLNNCRSAGSILKNWREFTLKNSRLLISAAFEINF
jgi:hypothetical protein